MPWNRLPHCSAKYQLSPNLTVKPLHVWSVFWLASIIEQLLVFNDDSHPLQSIWRCLRYEIDVSSLSRCQTWSNGMIRCRSISTVEGSGATCTRNFFEFFFQNRWSFYGPVDPKNSKNFKKVKKTPKMHWHHTTQMVMETLVTSG